jgi:hypothetical protein
VALAGCGDDDTYKNDPRPPRTLVISAAIQPKGVSVSPTEFGAGPISLLISNQTGASQRLSIVREVNGQTQANEQTGPINPGDTATLKVNVDEGNYEIRVEGQGIDPAKIEVGPLRESAQNELLQP